jgi:hypothetical protein
LDANRRHLNRVVNHFPQLYLIAQHAIFFLQSFANFDLTESDSHAIRMSIKSLRLIAGVCTAILTVSCPAQTILGKHPADKVLPAFFNQNGNADTTMQGINGSSVSLSPTRVPGLDASKITSGVLDPARIPAGGPVTSIRNTDQNNSVWRFDGLSFSNITKSGLPAFSVYDSTILADRSWPVFGLNGQLNIGDVNQDLFPAFPDFRMFTPFVNILNIYSNGTIQAGIDANCSFFGNGLGLTNIPLSGLGLGPFRFPDRTANFYELDMGDSFYDWGPGKSFTRLHNGILEQVAYEGGEHTIFQINRSDVVHPWTLEIDSPLRIPANAGSGLVLTSDANGNAGWALLPSPSALSLNSITWADESMSQLFDSDQQTLTFRGPGSTDLLTMSANDGNVRLPTSRLLAGDTSWDEGYQVAYFETSWDRVAKFKSTYDAGDGGAAWLTFENASGDAFMEGAHHGSGNPYVFFLHQNGNKIAFINSDWQGARTFAGKLVLTTDVGGSTLDPSERLYVEGDANVTGSLSLGSVKILTGSGNPPADVAPNGSLYLSTGGGGKMYLRVNGAWVQK